MDSGLVSLHMKGMLWGKSSAMSKNWLVLGRGSFSPASKASDARAPRIQKIRNYSVQTEFELFQDMCLRSHKPKERTRRLSGRQVYRDLQTRESLGGSWAEG